MPPKLKIGLFLLLVVLLIFILSSCFEKRQKDKNITNLENSEKRSKVIVEPDVMPMFVTLMFHDIFDGERKGTTTVSRKKLEEVLEYLSENRYNFLSAQEVFDFLTKKKPIPKKSVWLTFDDGLKSAHKEGTKLLKKYNARATAFVEVMQIGKPLRLTKSDLKSMVRSGVWDIQSHGYNGHNTSLTNEKGEHVNFYFNRLLIGDIPETEEDFKRRIKKDIQKSFNFLEKECNSKRFFFSYPMDDTTSEQSKELKIIQSCLNELGIIGVGVSGSPNFSTDWSTLKHINTRYGVRNSSNMEELFSIKNTGKRIYVSERKDTYVMTNIAKYINNQYIAWNKNGVFILLDENMRPIGNVFRIKRQNKIKEFKPTNKISIAVQPNGTVWVSDCNNKLLLQLDNSWSVKNEYKLKFSPVSIWFYENRLYIVDSGGNISSLDGNTLNLVFSLGAGINCVGGCAVRNVAYLSDNSAKKIYKINYVDKVIMGTKNYDNNYILIPQISDKEDQFIANEANNNVLVKVKY